MSLARIVSLGFRIGIRWAGFFSVALGASAGAVLSFDSSGNFQGIFASGSLVSSPSAVETGNGNVYVADTHSNQVAVFDPLGNLRFAFGIDPNGNFQADFDPDSV